MNMPTIDSAPGRSSGRPETVVPNTTSSSAAYRESSSAQAPCTTVPRVTPAVRAVRASRSERSSDRVVVCTAAERACRVRSCGRSAGSGVGVAKPASTPRQWSRAAPSSCSASRRT